MYQAIGLTDVGKVRTQNQDSYLFKEVEGLGLVLLVCDGMEGPKRATWLLQKPFR